MSAHLREVNLVTTVQCATCTGVGRVYPPGSRYSETCPTCLGRCTVRVAARPHPPAEVLPADD